MIARRRYDASYTVKSCAAASDMAPARQFGISGGIVTMRNESSAAPMSPPGPQGGGSGAQQGENVGNLISPERRRNGAVGLNVVECPAALPSRSSSSDHASAIDASITSVGVSGVPLE